MSKQNEFVLSGFVDEITDNKFLTNGAEVETIVIKWTDTWETGSRECKAAISFYAKNGLEKLHKMNLAIGDLIQVPCTIGSKVKEGANDKGEYRFWQTNIQGDCWKVSGPKKESPVAVPTADIPF